MVALWQQYGNQLTVQHILVNIPSDVPQQQNFNPFKPSGNDMYHLFDNQ
jgi:hypothetical protein